MQINSKYKQTGFAQMQEIADWNDYLYFLKVADCASLKAAARELGVNHSTVFRRINGLEEKLKVQLFERLPIGYKLTKAGADIIERVQRMDEQMHAIGRIVQGQEVALSGVLKLSTTDTIGYFWLPPFIRRFKELYPEITIDIDIKTRYTNLSKREADIVIPAVNRQPDAMVGKRLAPIYFKLYGSRQYIEQYGRPKDTTDFPGHRFLLPNDTLAGLPANKWLRQLITEHCISVCSDKLTGLYQLAKQHLGLTILPHYLGQSDPDLVEVLELPEHCHHHIWILTHPDLRYTARIDAFMRFMYAQTEPPEI